MTLLTTLTLALTLSGGGVQWIGTIDAGLAEARRTNRPILLVSAAPHCHEIPGIW